MASRDRDQVHIASRLVTDRVAVMFDRHVPEHARGELLDLGCGQAPLYEIYRDHADAITCVDWPGSPHDVQHADLLCDVNEPLSIADDSFDTIICSDVLEHLHSPHVTVAEIARMLRPGGKVLISVPFVYGIHEQPHDHHRYTRFVIEHWASKHGLKVIVLDELGGIGDVLCNILGKLLARLPIIGTPSIAMVNLAWNLACRVPGVRHVDLKTAAQFPIEYFAVLEKPSTADSTDGGPL